MKKFRWLVAITVVVLAIQCMVLCQQINAETAKMESLCQGSAGRALENFKKYEAEGRNANYLSGVAEFRSFMIAYLYLNDNVSNAEYLWCNIIYGDMVLHPEKVKSNVGGLIEALECLSNDYDNVNGFILIHNYSNEMTYGKD